MIRLADMLCKAGKARDSVKIIDALLASGEEDAHYGSLASQRVRFLFEANDDRAVISDAWRCRDDARCEAYLPEMMFMAWRSAQRSVDCSSSEKTELADFFFKTFPTHPLGAHIYFDQAVAAIKKTDYANAKSTLLLLESKYPSSDLDDQVHALMGRVNIQAEQMTLR